MGKPPRTFRDWLSKKLADDGVARRELARRLASKNPGGSTQQSIETYRRAIYRYLDPNDPMRPNEQTRAAFAEAFGVDASEVPVDDEAEDLEAALRAIVDRAVSQQLQALKRAGVLA